MNARGFGARAGIPSVLVLVGMAGALGMLTRQLEGQPQGKEKGKKARP
ncbi:MAG: hypothetical protein JO323_01930, partial [Acidobacteriia bacterium]|nr:hypothetical protein [Terriglobia bacterium]